MPNNQPTTSPPGRGRGRGQGPRRPPRYGNSKAFDSANAARTPSNSTSHATTSRNDWSNAPPPLVYHGGSNGSARGAFQSEPRRGRRGQQPTELTRGFSSMTIDNPPIISAESFSRQTLNSSNSTPGSQSQGAMPPTLFQAESMGGTTLPAKLPLRGGNARFIPPSFQTVDDPQPPETPFVHQLVDDAHLAKLRSLVHSRSILTKYPFTLQPLDNHALLSKRRCSKCKIAWKKVRNDPESDDEESVEDYNRRPKEKDQPPILRCKYHTGTVFHGRWSCCGAPPGQYSKPCSGSEYHHLADSDLEDIQRRWQLHRTPSVADGQHPSPASIKSAIAIDCEMGMSVLGESELIRVTVIDYDSRQVLLDKLVWPEARMAHFNTKYSGVTASAMNYAFRQGTCLMGTDSARREVFKFIAPDTVVIGHSVHNDLLSLRWIHDCIVDSFVLEDLMVKAEAQRIAEIEEERLKVSISPDYVPKMDISEAAAPLRVEEEPTAQAKNGDTKKPRKPKGSGRLSLKTLAMIRLGRPIQNSFGHDSKEDALAARDIVEWHIFNPTNLEKGRKEELVPAYYPENVTEW
ncbi:hypothetical protein BT63DRAFT_80190 [Microthyrium microscopicum]|uniref:Exonuclease domain-containing protein n=1 Tax=Microthyrium microscopicum TaxID=703497 RepID=A0A6A6TXX8_9PEZI|nr:hypothetical protein BT63DRAFT_80190 [Microthyrium microscopicum]